MRTLSRFRRLDLALALVLFGCPSAPPSDAQGPLATPATQQLPDSSPAPAGPAGSEQAASADASEFPPVLPYPPAPWRLAEPSALVRTVLWFSHIVIRHERSRPDVSFNPGFWASVAEPKRSRAQALEIAEQVAAQAARDPSRFPELSRKYSEDLSSRDEGGAMGGVTADQIMRWPQVLDTLSVLKPGETSMVVETRYGFHIFYRSAPPPDEIRSGSHIVIGHDRAPWGWVFASVERAPRPARTRDEALALAKEVYRQALAEPGRFAELVRRYSEHLDAVADGDLGNWSTREDQAFPARHKRLAELEVGEVGAPVETALGFEVIQRTPLRPRPRYRATVFRVPLDDVNSSVPSWPGAATLAAARARAEEAATLFLQDPSQFDALANPVPAEWEEGRDYADLTPALARLAVGQITPSPAYTQDGFVLAKRLEPNPVASSDPVETELPSPSPAAIAQALGTLSPSEAREFLSTFAARAAAELSLPGEATQGFNGLHELTGVNDTAEVGVRAQALSDMFERTRDLLSAPDYARYQAVLSRDVASLLPRDPVYGPLGL
jgi:hypothetical protein